MTRECPICGETPTEKIKVSREKFPDPSRTELEIHIKRNHKLEEIKKHLSKGKRKEVEATDAQLADVDKVIGEILDGSSSKAERDTESSKTKKSRTGRPAKSTKRGTVIKESKPPVRVSDTDTVGTTLEAKGLPKTTPFR